MTPNRELVALVDGIEIGRVVQDTDGRYSFSYADEWRRRRDAVPLSVSMPLNRPTHAHKAVAAFLWGLLPDNQEILAAWARREQVSAGNPFALLAHVGEDCAGAVQFVPPERVPELRRAQPAEIAWLTETDVGERLRRLREDQAAWRLPRDEGQFSLAGAQRKTALYFEDGRWGVPAGRTPTTHILKPPIPGFEGHVENEHLCLRLAHAVGLRVASSGARRFGDEMAIVVARYDRFRTMDAASAAHARGNDALAARLREIAASQPVLRLHQEDMCQALAVLPTNKYQSDGGPSPAAVVRVLRENSAAPDADVAAFVDALVFNWLIAGTDAHAKNYSLLHEAGGLPRLAPLYDVASVLPYPDLDARKIKLAMKVGSEYRLHDIRRRHWLDLAEELTLEAKPTITRAKDLAGRIVASTPTLRDELIGAGLDHPIVPRLAQLLVERAESCLRTLDAA
ncbi:MAG: type II toxin-antitoxin system HipA family toxin [Planctomycetes bacterium]|nr:type II toxin-antitoxin system HipA family toxin [Planctomycetota bacterium]